MEETKTFETTQPKKKKFPIGKIIFLLLVCVAAYFIWQNHVEKQREIEANTVRYEDVMNDPYTEEDIIILDAVHQIQEYANFIAANPDNNLYHFGSYSEAENIFFRLHYFVLNEFDLKNTPLDPKGSGRVVDAACEGIMFDNLSSRAKMEVIEICKEVYAELDETYSFFGIADEYHGMDTYLEEFRILREPEEVEEPPKELTATQQKIAEWKEAFLAWSAEIQAKNRERLGKR